MCNATRKAHVGKPNIIRALCFSSPLLSQVHNLRGVTRERERADWKPINEAARRRMEDGGRRNGCLVNWIGCRESDLRNNGRASERARITNSAHEAMSDLTIVPRIAMIESALHLIADMRRSCTSQSCIKAGKYRELTITHLCCEFSAIATSAHNF